MKNDKQNFSYAISRFFKIYLPGERGFSENTILSYRDTFKQFLTFCKENKGIEPEKLSLSDFTRELIIDFLAKLEDDGKSVSTRNQRLAAIKSFFGYVKYAFPEHLSTAGDILNIRVKKQPVVTVNYMTDHAVSRLLNQPDTSQKSGYRDMLMLTLLYDSGARVSEIVKIRVGDIRTQSPATITLHGKGDKDRIVPLSEKTIALVKNYLSHEKLDTTEAKRKYFFVNHSNEQLTRAGVTYILKKYTDLTRVELPGEIPPKFSPHCMRHSKAMHLLQAGVALIYIRDFLGHESIKTTEVYAKTDSKSKRAALDKAYTTTLPQTDDPMWNEDESLMKFLSGLCSNAAM